MTGVIRHRLTYILVLGVVTSALSLAALVRALSLSEGQRIERARDAVSAELDRLAQLAPSPGALGAAPITSYIGLHGGWLQSTDELDGVVGLPAAWHEPLARVIAQSARSTGKVVVDSSLAPSRLVLAATRSGDHFAWTGVALPPSNYLRPWRYIAIAIALATALLVATTLASVLSFRRQARALQTTLVALGKDLHTPVPRPTLAELALLSDGIERMAADLRLSREGTERLLRELAQKERLAALGRVTAGVAHEVRNPLAAIKLRLDVTAASGELPEATKLAVTAASQEIARLDRLVSDLLVVAGRRPGPLHSIELGQLARARAETLAPWAETQRVTITVEGEADATADPESLARAMDNLLRNAVEASPRGATVHARIAGDAGGATVRIEDVGAGVDPVRDAELFEPFFTTKPDGTGLGLALSRAIARAHGGDLTYAREAGCTCFLLRIPSQSAAESRA